MATVALRCPIGMASVTLHRLHVLADAHHGDLGVRALPGSVLGDLLQDGHFEVEAGCGVHDDLVTLSHDVTKRVAARGQQVAVFGIVLGGEDLFRRSLLQLDHVPYRRYPP